jgi:hypothetical protein
MVESTASGKTTNGAGGGGNVPFPTLLDPLNDRRCKTLESPAIKSLEATTLFHQSGNHIRIIINIRT